MQEESHDSGHKKTPLLLSDGDRGFMFCGSGLGAWKGYGVQGGKKPSNSGIQNMLKNNALKPRD